MGFRLLVPTALIFGTAAFSLAQTTRTTADGVYTDEQAKRGSETYQKECAPCHLPDLSGGGFSTPLIGPGFAQRWRAGNVGELFTIVRTTMPADKPNTLTAPQSADIIAFMLKMNGHPAGSQPLGDDPVTLKQIAFK